MGSKTRCFEERVKIPKVFYLLIRKLFGSILHCAFNSFLGHGDVKQKPKRPTTIIESIDIVSLSF